MRASLNHGNSLKGTKRSVFPIRSQKPWLETLVTSTAEVGVPSLPDVIFMLLNQLQHRLDVACFQTIVLSQLYLWFQPKLGFTVWPMHMHMEPWFFAREKVKAELALTKNRWTH